MHNTNNFLIDIYIVRCTAYTILLMNYVYHMMHNLHNFVTEPYTVGYTIRIILLLKYIL